MHPRIFVSYRREDSAFAVGRICDALAARYERDAIFMDVDSIRAGEDFRVAIDRALGRADVVLTVMGDRWLSCQDAQGRPRLASPGDFVRVELATALKQDKPVIPLLIGDAEMPPPAQMPEDIRDLAYRHALRLRPEPDFANDAAALVQAIELVTASAPPTPTPSTGVSRLFCESRRATVLVVELTHDSFVDQATCDELAGKVRELLAREASPLVVLELGRVELVAPSFLAVLIQLLGHCQRQGGRLAVVTPRFLHQELFRLHHLEGIFQLTDDLNEAVARLAPAEHTGGATRQPPTVGRPML